MFFCEPTILMEHNIADHNVRTSRQQVLTLRALGFIKRRYLGINDSFLFMSRTIHDYECIHLCWQPSNAYSY